MSATDVGEGRLWIVEIIVLGNGLLAPWIKERPVRDVGFDVKAAGGGSVRGGGRTSGFTLGNALI
ncbi:MAG: hypothetical protein V4489_00485 [Chlamydiota bacterium]